MSTAECVGVSVGGWVRGRYLVVLQQVAAGGGAIFVQRSQRHHPQLLGQLLPGDVLHRQHVHQPGKSVLVQRRGPALCSDTGETVSVKTLCLKRQQGVGLQTHRHRRCLASSSYC